MQEPGAWAAEEGNSKLMRQSHISASTLSAFIHLHGCVDEFPLLCKLVITLAEQQFSHTDREGWK